ncbi:MAG: UDP-N-acetylmuramoyl-L-alanine--D-glutamate ligase [Caldilineales bacterium]|nr:UDP-N-acetylmuramoyl-L-alanine--D-glutamate ligase [Caldilineales bacterium]MDW8316297.1 UDP-N-acetylmuramoyl-L-alanine--D-glutamate ligase [Anaerolineae bacterium]
MALESFAGKHVVILGLARQGLALTRFFVAQGARITVSDAAGPDQLQDALAALSGLLSPAQGEPAVRLALGGHPLSLLEECDLLCLSGGVPPQLPIVQEARRRGIRLSNDSILTLQRSPAPAVGITGSSGKTTTTTLVGLMLEAGGLAKPGADRPAVWVGGNIGTPLVDRLDQIRPADWLVLELSSFQLELFDEAEGGSAISPRVAAVLNVTPNHLDRHPSMAHYTACKANIVRWQGPEDVAVLGADNPITGAWLRTGQVAIEADVGQPVRSFPIRSRRLGFGASEPTGDGCWVARDRILLRLDGREQTVVTTEAVRLRGAHNLLNIAAACAAAAAVGVEPAAMAEVARTFAGVPHRLELVREHRGVRWINDSIATSPERAIAALRSFHEPIVLLAGGRDKKLPWEEFAALVHRRVKHLVLFGEAAELIGRAVAQADPASPLPITRCRDLAEAVQAAAGVAEPGDVVLLSPGGTSFDAYKDFEARGRHFRELVHQL